MVIDDSEKERLKNYVIGSTKLSYPDMKDSEVDDFIEYLEDLVSEDGKVENGFVPAESPVMHERKKKEKEGYPQGKMVVLCAPEVNGGLTFEHQWIEKKEDIPEDYGILFLVHKSSVDITFRGGDSCCVHVGSPDCAELLNQLQSFIRECSAVDIGIEYRDFSPLLDQSEYRCILVDLADKDPYYELAKSIMRLEPTEIVLLANGDIRFYDLKDFVNALRKEEASIDLFVRSTDAYGLTHAMVSLFFRREG